MHPRETSIQDLRFDRAYGHTLSVNVGGSFGQTSSALPHRVGCQRAVEERRQSERMARVSAISGAWVKRIL